MEKGRSEEKGRGKKRKDEKRGEEERPQGVQGEEKKTGKMMSFQGSS